MWIFRLFAAGGEGGRETWGWLDGIGSSVRQYDRIDQVWIGKDHVWQRGLNQVCGRVVGRSDEVSI